MQVEVPAQAVAGTVSGGGGGTSVAHVQKGGRGKVTHVLYSEGYYVPELRNYVKNFDETYNGDNVRLSRVTRRAGVVQAGRLRPGRDALFVVEPEAEHLALAPRTARSRSRRRAPDRHVPSRSEIEPGQLQRRRPRPRGQPRLDRRRERAVVHDHALPALGL